ncbi:Hint domain-containing protein [Acidisoma cellulosilytica]|uniref:Hint domain-containing protein n=1 Tax=Acidisoma cellulosilyticum TaxID=2802395 RepID=A0A964E561_9PROT|nr:Hint domain-containing protein [Acidisoma cellulosilyticum]MCB8882211.1 Hint domain-containing protein [Acidisoma cellulosilyticum]
MDSNVTGSPGANGTIGTGNGASGTSGFAGGDASATAAAAADSTNTAEALGGDGGIGAGGAANTLPDQDGGSGGDGGDGGDATAASEVTHADTDGNSAKATATGGDGGNGGVGGLPAAASGVGGDGGSASASATASNTAGIASASATATGGSGGDSQYDTPLYTDNTYIGIVHPAGNGANVSGSTASASGTTMATATVTQTGGSGGDGPAGGDGGSSTLTDAVSGKTDDGSLNLNQTANGGGGGYGGPYAGPDTATGGNATSDLTLSDTSSSQVTVELHATGGDGGPALQPAGGLLTEGNGGQGEASGTITGAADVYDDVFAAGGYGNAQGGTATASGNGTAGTLANVYVTATGGGANIAGGGANAVAVGTGPTANVTALATGGTGEATTGKATAKATGIGPSGSANASAGGSYENNLVGTEEFLNAGAVAAVLGNATAYAAQSQGDKLGALDTTDQAVSMAVLNPTAASNGTDFGTGDQLLVDIEQGAGNYASLSGAVTNIETLAGQLDFSADPLDSDLLLDLAGATMVGTGVTEVDLHVQVGFASLYESFASGAAALAYFDHNVINLGSIGDLEDSPAQLNQTPVYVTLSVTVDAPDSGFYANSQIGVGSTVTGPDVFTQTETAAGGDYLWSDVANWSLGLPTAGASVVMTGQGVDDIAGLSLASLSLSPGTASADGVLTVTDGLTVDALTIAHTSEIDVTGGTVTLDSVATVSGSGIAPTLYAIGAGAVIEDADATPPALDYIAQGGGMVQLAAAPNAASQLTYIGGGIFALAAPGTTTDAQLAYLGSGDVLELPGTTVSNVALGSDSLSITTDAGTFVFSNVTYDVGGVASFSARPDSKTGLEAITFYNPSGYALAANSPGTLTVGGDTIVSGSTYGISNATDFANGWTIVQNGTVIGGVDGIANLGTLAGGWDIESNAALDGTDGDGIVNTGSIAGGWDIKTNSATDGGTDGIANTGTVTGGWGIQTNAVLDGGTDGIANTGSIAGGWDIKTNSATDGGTDAIANTGTVAGGWGIQTNAVLDGGTDGIVNTGTVIGGWDIQTNAAVDGGTDGILNTGNVTSGWDIQVNGPFTSNSDGTVDSGSVTGGKIGIEDKNGGGMVVNGGSITGQTDSGIVLSNGGIVNNTAGGLISGHNDGVVIGGGGTVTNAGTIAATAGDAVDFLGKGTNKLIVHPGAVFVGAVTAASGGDNLLELADGPDAATAGTLSGLGAGFTGFSDITVDADADWDLTGNTSLAEGAKLSDLGTLTAEAGFTNNGLILTDPATLTFAGAVTGSGTIDIGAGSDVTFDNSVSNSETVAFTSNTGTLTLGDLSAFHADSLPAAPVSGFVAGDQVQAAALVGASASFSSSGGDAKLSFTHDGKAIGSLTFSGAYTSETLLFDSTTGAVDTTATAPCFVKGTHILTIRGPVTVETLRVGDHVLTIEGSARPVQWLGRRSIDCRRHPTPSKVNPVRIKAGAFGSSLPERDLYLSPDHAVFVEDVLIPVKHLINDRTISQVQADVVRYYHVELPRHGIVLAEGLPTESYLDTGDRTSFVGGDVTALHPAWGSEAMDVSLLMDAIGYAPLRVAGDEVNRAKALLAAQAAFLDTEPGPFVAGPSGRNPFAFLTDLLPVERIE